MFEMSDRVIYIILFVVVLFIIGLVVLLIVLFLKNKKETRAIPEEPPVSNVEEPNEPWPPVVDNDMNPTIGLGNEVISGVPMEEKTRVQRLMLMDTSNPSRRFSCAIEPTMTVGRNQGNKIIIDDSTVSGTHCQFELINGMFTVRDMGSSNGTYMSGKRITGRTAIKSGMKIQIGGTEYIISLL